MILPCIFPLLRFCVLYCESPLNMRKQKSENYRYIIVKLTTLGKTRKHAKQHHNKQNSITQNSKLKNSQLTTPQLPTTYIPHAVVPHSRCPLVHAFVHSCTWSESPPSKARNIDLQLPHTWEEKKKKMRIEKARVSVGTHLFGSTCLSPGVQDVQVDECADCPTTAKDRGCEVHRPLISILGPS